MQPVAAELLTQDRLMDLLDQAVEQLVEQGADRDTIRARAPEFVGEVLAPLTVAYTRSLYEARNDLLLAINNQRAEFEDELDRLWHTAFASYETMGLLHR